MIAGGILTRFDGRAFEPIPIESVQGGRTIPGMELPHALSSGGGDTLWVVTWERRLLVRARGGWSYAFEVQGSIDELRAVPGSPPAYRSTVADGAGLFVSGISTESEPLTFGSGLEPLAGPLLWMARDGTTWAMMRDRSAAITLPPAPRRELPADLPRFVLQNHAPEPLIPRVRGDRLQVEDPSGAVWASIPWRSDRTPLLLTRDGRLLVHSGEALEIHRPRTGSIELVATELPLPLNEISDLLEDREGGLWIATGSHGLLQLRQRGAIEVTASDGGQVESVAVGRDGTVLALGFDILRIDRETIEPLDRSRFPPHRQITALLEDGVGRLWTGVILTDGSSEIWMEASGGVRRRFGTRGIPREILEDLPRRRILWLADEEWCELPLGGVGAPEPRCHDLVGFHSRDVLVARAGSVWISGQGGVRVYQGGRVRDYTPAAGYPLDWSRGLLEDRDGGMWIGSYFRGLALLRGDTVYRAMRAQGLAEDVVSTLLEDEAGNLWMGGNQGIHRARRAELLALFRGERSRIRATLLDAREGLRNPEGSGWQAQRDGSGRLWFPTFGGAVGVLPASTPALNSAPGRVTLDALEADGRLWPVSDTLKLPTGVRALRVSVAAVSLQFPEAEVVKYRLEGHGNTWQPALGSRTLEFTSLRPGSWRLEVEAWGAEGEETNRAAMQIVVPPLFRETGVFQGLVLLAVLALVATLVLLRTRSLTLRAESLQLEVEEQTHWLRIENERTVAALERAADLTDQLRTLLTSKSRVFASLSHELRTPLTLLSGPLGEIQGDVGATDRRLSVMRQAVQRLERLTGQFLDLADAQSGALRLHRKPLELSRFLRSCAQEVRHLAERRGVRLELDVPEEGVEVLGDPDHLDKVILNLLSNAQKHSSPGDVVRVALRQDFEEGASVARIEVMDQGPGIPEVLHGRIFEPFFQGPEATEGMGLGLSLARDVVVMHGGRIEVEAPPGGGALFRVTLPLLPRDRVVTAATEISSTRSQQAAAPTPRTSADGPPIRVLLVEDEFDLLEYLARSMEGRFEVRVSEHGEGALEVLRGWTPDLILSDLVMPGIDGLALCRILKADPALRAVPFILITARGQGEDQERGLLAGADDYVVKPFDVERLFLKIENLVALSRRIEDRFSQSFPAWATSLLRRGVHQLDSESELFLARFHSTVLDRIGDHDLDMEQLSRALHMSRSTLFRRCRELLGSSPTDLISEIRLEEATRLLADPHRSVSSVGFAVGFRSPSSFTRRFTAHFGMSPKTWRARTAPKV